MARSSVLRNLMLYFSISVLVNTCFFPTIQMYMLGEATFVAPPDSSLAEVILENLLGFEDEGILLGDDADDVSATVDFLSTRPAVLVVPGFFVDSKGLLRNYNCPDQPTLKRFTPPPKA